MDPIKEAAIARDDGLMGEALEADRKYADWLREAPAVFRDYRDADIVEALSTNLRLADMAELRQPVTAPLAERILNERASAREIIRKMRAERENLLVALNKAVLFIEYTGNAFMSSPASECRAVIENATTIAAHRIVDADRANHEKRLLAALKTIVEANDCTVESIREGRAAINAAEGASEGPPSGAVASTSNDPVRAELVEALRRRSIIGHVRMTYGGGTVPSGGSCALCHTEWNTLDEDGKEHHKPTCLLAKASTPTTSEGGK